MSGSALRFIPDPTATASRIHSSASVIQTMLKIRDDVGELIREYRKSRGMSQRDLSETMGRRSLQAQISHWERGAIMPDLDSLRDVAAALEVPVEAFCLGGSEFIGALDIMIAKHEVLLEELRAMRDAAVQAAEGKEPAKPSK